MTVNVKIEVNTEIPSFQGEQTQLSPNLLSGTAHVGSYAPDLVQ